MKEHSNSHYLESVFIAENVIDFFKAKRYLTDRLTGMD